MRCRACNVILSDYELMLVDSDGAPYDMCTKCLRHIPDAPDVDITDEQIEQELARYEQVQDTIKIN